ncbi:MAG: hypothetical protein MJ151_01270 [Lachnospiraceae bacterium]|nr:hypothetical protein [Lachnospiraceae bacterium]
MYYANDEGYLVTGFQRLTVFTDAWIKEYKKKDVDNTGEMRWFYFMPSGADKYRKYYSEDQEHDVKTIDNKKYCFDTNGIMCIGWQKIKDKEPVIAGYMFFAEEETEKFAYGQAIAGSWFTAEGPVNDDITGDVDVRYYYFKHSGEPVCAKEGEYLKYRIGEKYYCFNDKGVAVYGVKKIGSDYYYFGNSMADCSMKSGKLNVDTGSGYKMDYYFDNDGRGYTGVYKDKLYYKGLLQKAESGVAAIKIDGVTRLVNTNGQILKNKKKYKDSDGVTWSTNASGVVTYTDEGEASGPEEPETTGDD